MPSLRLLATALLVLTAGCSPGERGVYAHTRRGTILATPPPWTAWPDTLQARCDDRPEEGVLARAPYLQATTAQSTRILWRSEAPAETERVRYWPAADAEDVAVAPASGGEGWSPRSARLSGLTAATTYCYAVVRDGAVAEGPFAFETAPAALDAAVDLIVLGDSGTGWIEQYRVFDHMRRVPSDLILHTGDIAYDSGRHPELEDNVFEVYGPLLRSVPLFPSIGNHDVETDGGAPYLTAFAPPASEPGGERFYSYDWGPLHVAVLDSTIALAEQVTWLDRDLTGTTRPWIVVYLHHPPYSAGRHGSEDDLRDTLAPVLERHRVALVFSGHDHHYERSRPIGGVTYVVTGGGGRQITDVDPEAHTAHADSVLHFVYARVEGDTARLYAIDGMGEVFDSFVVQTER